MEITVSTGDPEQFTGDLVIYLVRQGPGKAAPRSGNKQVDRLIARAFTCGDFLGKEEQTLSFYPEQPAGVEGGHKAGRILVVGLGKEELSRELFRRCGGAMAQYVSKIKAPSVLVVLGDHLNFPGDELGECLVEGIILGAYTFRRYKTKERKESDKGRIEKLVFHTATTALVRKGGQRGQIAANAACMARDMANEPGNYFTARHFAEQSLQIAKRYGLNRKVLSKKDMERLKMGGILGVNQGSFEPPKLVILEYRTGKEVPTLLFVGKGLTFDSGGISIKAGAGMEEMKYDMCGGAAVLAAMDAVGRLRPRNVDIVAMIPATDNMPGPAALKPGDVVRQYNGKTVEIISTDAEGRLIMADALSYGVKHYRPDAVVDLATLTGAVITGLGHHRSGLMSNDDQLAGRVEKAAEKSGEPLWRLPLGDEYSKQLESKIADLKNVGGKGAGTITAGCFLQEFVGKAPWAHLDIAGTAWNYTEKSYVPKGASGVGVRTLIELIRMWK